MIKLSRMEQEEKSGDENANQMLFGKREGNG
jgi:hypothetical protein